jgi:hypothetical protein
MLRIALTGLHGVKNLRDPRPKIQMVHVDDVVKIPQK